MSKSTCQSCERTVIMVPIDGELVAHDPEVIRVTPARQVRGDSGGGIRMGTKTTPARRLHGDLCDTYQEQARRDRIASDQRAFNKKHGRLAPRRNHGL